MKNIIYLIWALCFIPFTSSWAITKPIYSLAFSQDYSQNKIGNSQLIVFDSGLLNFETNAGAIHFLVEILAQSSRSQPLFYDRLISFHSFS